MSYYHRSWDSQQGKATRIRMIRRILKDNGGRMKRGALEKRLKVQGYHLLIGRLEAMGFTVDVDGYVYGD